MTFSDLLFRFTVARMSLRLGRFADPDEVSKIFLFIASKQNTYITGQNIVIDEDT